MKDTKVLFSDKSREKAAKGEGRGVEGIHEGRFQCNGGCMLWRGMSFWRY